MTTSKVDFWKFVDHPIKTTAEQAAAIARQIEVGDFVPGNSSGERFYKLGGYCYDLGRKPYLVEYAHGHIQRHWALSRKELRTACHLRRRDKVVSDPFYREEDEREVQTA